VEKFKNAPTTIKALKRLNFGEIGLLGKLMNSETPSESILSCCGVYAATCPIGYKPKFINQDEASKHGNVIKPWSDEQLKDKWVRDVEVVYIGVAGVSTPRSLRKRIRDLLRHGNGFAKKNGPHRGGEILWQLRGYKKFSLWILPTTCPPAPRNTEDRLINAFEDATGFLPFANRRHASRRISE